MASGGYDTKEEAREAAGGGGVKKISGKYVPVKKSTSKQTDSKKSGSSPSPSYHIHQATYVRELPSGEKVVVKTSSSGKSTVSGSGAKKLPGGRVKVGGATYSEKDYVAMVEAGKQTGIRKAPDVQEREYQSAKGWFEEVEVEEERKYPLYEDKAAFLYTPIEYFPGEKFEDTGVKPVGTTKIPITEAFLEGPDILRVYPGGDAPGGPVDIITKEAKEAGRTVKREGDKLITRKPIYITYKEEEQSTEQKLAQAATGFQEGGVYAPIESFFGETSQVVVRGMDTPEGMFGELRSPGSKEIADVFIVKGGKKVGLTPMITVFETDTGTIVQEEYSLPIYGDDGRAALQKISPDLYASQQAELSDKLTEQMTGARTLKGRTLTPVAARLEDELRRAENIPFLKPMADIGRAIGEEVYVASQTVEYPYYTELAIAGSAPFIRTAAEPWFQGLVAKGVEGGAEFTFGAGLATAQILGVGVGIQKEFAEEFAPLALGKTFAQGRLPTRTAGDVAMLGAGLGVGLGVAGLSYAGAVGATAMAGNLGTAGLMVAEPMAYLAGGVILSTAAIGTGARAATRGAQFAEEVGSGRYLLEIGAYRPGPTSAPAARVSGLIFQEEGGVARTIGKLTGTETKFLSSEFFGLEARVLESKSSTILSQEFAEGAIARRSLVIPEGAQSFEDVVLLLEPRGGGQVVKRSASEVERILAEEVSTLQGRTLLSDFPALREAASELGLYRELQTVAWDEFFGEMGAIAGRKKGFTTTATEIFEIRAPVATGKVPILSEEGFLLGSLDEELFISTKPARQFLSTASTQEVAENILFSFGKTVDIEGVASTRFISLFERVKVPKGAPTKDLGQISGIGVGGETMVEGGMAQATKILQSPFKPTPSMIEATMRGPTRVIVPSKGVTVPGIGSIVAPPATYSVAEFDVAFTAPPLAPMVQVSRGAVSPIKAFENALASNVVVVTKSGLMGRQKDLFKISSLQGYKTLTEEDQTLVGIMVEGQVAGPRTKQKPRTIVDIVPVFDIGQPSGQRQPTDTLIGQIQPTIQLTAPVQITETITAPIVSPPGFGGGMFDVPPPPVLPIIPPFMGFMDTPRKVTKGKKALQASKYKPSLIGIGYVPGLPGFKISKIPKFVSGGGIRGVLEPKKGKKKKKKKEKTGGKPWWFA